MPKDGHEERPNILHLVIYSVLLILQQLSWAEAVFLRLVKYCHYVTQVANLEYCAVSVFTNIAVITILVM